MSEEAAAAAMVSRLSDSALREELSLHSIAFGPIVKSTRKMYEKKLQKVLVGQQQNEHGNGSLMNGTMNGDGSEHGGTPVREMTPLEEQQNSETVVATAREKTPIVQLDEENSDDDEEPSESARVLTPDEIRKFRNNFTNSALSQNGSSRNQLRQRNREYSPPMGVATNAASKKSSAIRRYGTSALLIGLSAFLIFAFGWLREYIVPIWKVQNDGKGN